MSTTYTWYVEALDSGTNEILSREINGASEHKQRLCVVGEDRQIDRRDLWQIPSGELTKLKESKKWSNFPVRYIVFRQKGNGQIEEWPPGQKRKVLTGKDAVDEADCQF